MARVLVFDSGAGGLTIAEALRRAAPDLTVDYAADAGFFPYGVKSDSELRDRLPGLCAALCDRAHPDVLVIACNTASTLSLEEIRSRVSIPVVGTVPAIRPAALKTRSGVIGVLATPGTIRRPYLSDLEKMFAAGTTVIRRGSAGLVDLAERAVRGQEIDAHAVAEEVAPLFAGPDGEKIDIVVLACTHFPLIRAEIAAACPPGVELIDSGDAVARQALRLCPPRDPDAMPPSAATAYVTGGIANLVAMQPALKRFGYELIEVVDL
ncbi:MAG: glutamate racemase [Alphaproteobacteria bacterium]|nr:glutamate racemase [Alphaproteobacteria bacterium]